MKGAWQMTPIARPVPSRPTASVHKMLPSEPLALLIAGWIALAAIATHAETPATAPAQPAEAGGE
jgi:hypothetical protein